MHLRPPSIDHGVISFIWAVVLGAIIWAGMRAIGVSEATSVIISAVAAGAIFLYVRIYGEDAPRVEGAAVTAYDVELLYLARKRGYRIAEVPVCWRHFQNSKVSPLRDSWRLLRDVLTVRLNAWLRRYA
jgi:hypothetical protein